MKPKPTAVEPAAEPEPFCILSMDGATPEGGGYITAGLLHDLVSHLNNGNQALERNHPVLKRRASRRERISFLGHKVKRDRDQEKFVLAGVSSGAWSALYLADQKDPDDVLQYPQDAFETRHAKRRGKGSLLRYWRELTDAMSPENSTLLRLAGAALGSCAVSSSSRLREFFLEVFGRRTLGDLKHKVFIPAFQLDNQSPRRTWEPKYFCNFGDHATSDELIVDVALRTSSAPVFLPVFQSIIEEGPGYLDGGMLANNPAMCALGEVVRELKRAAATEEATARFETLLTPIWKAIGNAAGIPGGIKQQVSNPSFEKRVGTLLPMMFQLANIRLLSVGNGISSTFVDIEPQAEAGTADWGYRPWLLDLARPGLLIHAVWKAGELAVHRQCDALLGDGLYQRLQPFLPQSFERLDGAAAVQTVKRMWDLDWTEEKIHEIVSWLRTDGWNPAPVSTRGR